MESFCGKTDSIKTHAFGVAFYILYLQNVERIGSGNNFLRMLIWEDLTTVKASDVKEALIQAAEVWGAGWRRTGWL